MNCPSIWYLLFAFSMYEPDVIKRHIYTRTSQTPIYFVCNMFNDVVNNSDSMASIDSMIVNN